MPPTDKRREHDHIGTYNFSVEIGGNVVAWFKAVSGLQAECEPIEYMNGDEGILRKRPGRVKYGNITFKRGFADKGVDSLWNWWMTVQNGKVERKSGSIILYNDHYDEVVRYTFTEAWPVKWKGWDLDAQGNSVAVEELEIIVESLKRENPTGK